MPLVRSVLEKCRGKREEEVKTRIAKPSREYSLIYYVATRGKGCEAGVTEVTIVMRYHVLEAYEMCT